MARIFSVCSLLCTLYSGTSRCICEYLHVGMICKLCNSEIRRTFLCRIILSLYRLGYNTLRQNTYIETLHIRNMQKNGNKDTAVVEGTLLQEFVQQKNRPCRFFASTWLPKNHLRVLGLSMISQLLSLDTMTLFCVHSTLPFLPNYSSQMTAVLIFVSF